MEAYNAGQGGSIRMYGWGIDALLVPTQGLLLDSITYAPRPPPKRPPPPPLRVGIGTRETRHCWIQAPAASIIFTHPRRHHFYPPTTTPIIIGPLTHSPRPPKPPRPPPPRPGPRPPPRCIGGRMLVLLLLYLGGCVCRVSLGVSQYQAGGYFRAQKSKATLLHSLVSVDKGPQGYLSRAPN